MAAIKERTRSFFTGRPKEIVRKGRGGVWLKWSEALTPRD
jgi:hypothetical protein